jgi:hypothetical protein
MLKNSCSNAQVTRPMLGFKLFDAAQCTLASVKLMRMIKKKQIVVAKGKESLTAAAPLYSLAP